MQEHFPITLLPPEIRRVLTELPPLPPFKEVAPQMPNPNIKQINVPLLVIAFAIVLVLGLIIVQSNTSNSIFGLLFITAGVVAVSFQAWVQGQSHPRRLKLHTQRLESYYAALELYSQKEAEYQQVVATSRSPEQLKAFRYPRLLQALARTTKEDGQQEFFQLTAWETQFLNRLAHYFGDKISTRSFLSMGGLSPYVTDFAYSDRAVNLRVDIEIDQPFHPENFTPTHYQRNIQDQAWNDFFLSQGWCVLRFSQAQVQQFPDSCCKALATLIHQIFEDASILAPFESIADLPSQPRWTEQEARELAMARQTQR